MRGRGMGVTNTGGGRKIRGRKDRETSTRKSRRGGKRY